MLKNYIKTSIRFLSKNRAYGLINILGLSVGMSCFILLTLFAQKEFSYDEYHVDKERIFQVYLGDTSDSRSAFNLQTMAPMGPLFEAAVPQVSEAIRFGRRPKSVIKLKGGEIFQVDRIYLADKGVFDFFSIPLLTGTSEGALSSINNIVISRKEALRLFGGVAQAVEQVIEIVDLGKLTITGVFENLPDNTHLDFDYILPFEAVDKAMPDLIKYTKSKTALGWGTVSAFPLYVKLTDSGLDLNSLNIKLQEALSPHRPNDIVKLLPISEIYFSELYNGYFGKSGEKANVQLYIIIAFIILGVAMINYMNMATARYSKRAKEVGIRKTVGGHRSQIANQFIVESLIVTFISLLIAICLTEIFLPSMNLFIGKELAIAYDVPSTYLVFILFTLALGLLSGVYPSLYLSRFSPIQMLSGKVTGGKGGAAFRKVLVGFQFFVCLGLIATTAIVYKQFNYMQNIDLGIEEEQVVGIALEDTNLKENYNIFKERLSSNPAIAAVSGVSFSVFNGNSVFYTDIEGMEESQSITYMSVESNFLNTVGINMSFGEPFSNNKDLAEKKGMLVNKAAVEKFNWENPIGIKLFGASITGVTEDFIYGSAKRSIQPMVMTVTDEGFEYVYVKLNGSAVKAGLGHIQSIFEEFSIDYPFDYKFLDDHFADKYKEEKRLSDVFSIFSILAIFVAGLGIFGLSIFMAEQRVKEIGIRKTLGASIGHIVWILNNNITILMGVVALITLPLVYYFMGEWLAEFAYHISIDLLLLIIPLVSLMVIVWGILMFQSLKAAKMNLVKALRNE